MHFLLPLLQILYFFPCCGLDHLFFRLLLHSEYFVWKAQVISCVSAQCYIYSQGWCFAWATHWDGGSMEPLVSDIYMYWVLCARPQQLSECISVQQVTPGWPKAIQHTGNQLRSRVVSSLSNLSSSSSSLSKSVAKSPQNNPFRILKGSKKKWNVYWAK